MWPTAFARCARDRFAGETGREALGASGYALRIPDTGSRTSPDHQTRVDRTADFSGVRASVPRLHGPRMKPGGEAKFPQ